MPKRHIIIVGAGPGGLTSGMILSHRGFKVTIFEKSPMVGGRNSPLKLGAYTFDSGPTFLMMDFILKEMFSEVEQSIEDYLNLIRIEPMYRLVFDDRQILSFEDPIKMKEQINKIFLENEKGFDLFLKKESKRFDYLFPCLQIDYSRFNSLFSLRLLKALPHLSLSKTLFQNLGKYFKDDKLKLTFTFQSKYIGMSPWECPAAFTIIPYIEYKYGIFHVAGGLNQISNAMAKIIKECDGEIFTNTPVKKLLIEHKTVKGVELFNGDKVLADEVIINADFAYAMANLVETGILKKYSLRRLKAKRYSCSTFMLYLGINKRYDLLHHNIFFANDYKRNVEEIFNRKIISKDISFYIQNACISDNSLAPKDKSTIYVLVPVPNNVSNIDWDQEKYSFRNLIIETIKQKANLKDIENHIEVEKIITPLDWERDYNIFYGATFNLSHNLSQMLYFRPRNAFEELKNCYLVGGGTHPGSGLPTIYESARISSNLISKKYNIPFVKPTKLNMKKINS